MPALNDYVQVTGEHGTDSSGNATPFGYFGNLSYVYTHMRYTLISQSNGIDYWQNTFLRQQYDTVYFQPNDEIHDIRYNTNAGSVGWEDAEVATSSNPKNPVTATESGNTVRLKNAAGTLIGTFTSPYTTSSAQTSSLPVLSPGSGSIVGGTPYTFTVFSTSPSTTVNTIYSIFKDDVFYSHITHSNGANTTVNVGLSSREDSNWKLKMTTNAQNSINNATIILATFSAARANMPKKVHSNFW